MSAGKLRGIDGDFLGFFEFAGDFDRRLYWLLGLDGRLGFDAECIVDVRWLGLNVLRDGRGRRGLGDFNRFGFHGFDFHRLGDV